MASAQSSVVAPTHGRPRPLHRRGTGGQKGEMMIHDDSSPYWIGRWQQRWQHWSSVGLTGMVAASAAVADSGISIVSHRYPQRPPQLRAHELLRQGLLAFVVLYLATTTTIATILLSS